MGTKTVRFCIGPYVRKRAVSPLQQMHLHITCWSLPLLLLTVVVVLVGPLTRRVRCDDQRHQHIHGTYVPCSRTHDHQYLVIQHRRSHNPRQQIFLYYTWYVGTAYVFKSLVVTWAKVLSSTVWHVQRPKCVLLKRAKTCPKAFLLFARLMCASRILTKESTFQQKRFCQKQLCYIGLRPA